MQKCQHDMNLFRHWYVHLLLTHGPLSVLFCFKFLFKYLSVENRPIK